MTVRQASALVRLDNENGSSDQKGQRERTAGFGDTVLGVALAHRPLFGSRLVVGAGPTFVFPTSSERELGQEAWQFGHSTEVSDFLRL